MLLVITNIIKCDIELFMPPKSENFELTVADRQALEALLQSPNTAQSIVLRARIALLLGAGETVIAVSASTGVSRTTVYTWRNRFKVAGLDGLCDKPHTGRPKKLLSEHMIKEVLRLTVERIPREATHWSINLMAKYSGVKDWQIRQIWNTYDLKPHGLNSFKIINPQFVKMVVDVVGLYMNPPDNAVVLSVDEKTQIQARDRTQPMLQPKPGKIECRSHGNRRNGTMSLFTAFDILTDEVLGTGTKCQRAKEFLDFLRQIEKSTPKVFALHIILNNSSIHKTVEVQKWLDRHPRITLHFTPTSASWLNAAESWFLQLERRSIYRGVYSSVIELRHSINHLIEVHNAIIGKPFKWTKSASAIIDPAQRAKETANITGKN